MLFFGVGLCGGYNNKICVLFTKSHSNWLNNKRGLCIYSYVSVCYSYVSVCTCMLPVCYPYVTGMYPYVPVCYSYVPVCIVCYSYVTRMLLVVLVWSISHDHVISYKLRIIQEYFQPKIGRKIRIFSLGRKNNLLIKNKECTVIYSKSFVIKFVEEEINRGISQVPLQQQRTVVTCLLVAL